MKCFLCLHWCSDAQPEPFTLVLFTFSIQEKTDDVTMVPSQHCNNMRRGSGTYRASAAAGNFRTPTNKLPQINSDQVQRFSKYILFQQELRCRQAGACGADSVLCVCLYVCDGETVPTASKILIKGCNNLSTINSKQRIRGSDRPFILHTVPTQQEGSVFEDSSVDGCHFPAERPPLTSAVVTFCIR